MNNPSQRDTPLNLQHGFEPPGKVMMSVSRCFRLGHAFWTVPATSSDVSDVAEVLAILLGKTSLKPRLPADPGPVLLAEKLLGATVRLIYTFSGCLHPKLGTIGLVISPQLLDRALQGVSRCDTGGLTGRRGAFNYIPEDQIEGVLQALSFGTSDTDWEDAFNQEVMASYATQREYIAGVVPNYRHWGDARAACIDRAGSDIDRRLWTWEFRLSEPPLPSDFEGLVLSPEAFKRLEELRQNGEDVPDSVRVIHGSISPGGVHYFQEDAVIDLLQGTANL